MRPMPAAAMNARRTWATAASTSVSGRWVMSRKCSYSGWLLSRLPGGGEGKSGATTVTVLSLTARTLSPLMRAE